MRKKLHIKDITKLLENHIKNINNPNIEKGIWESISNIRNLNCIWEINILSENKDLVFKYKNILGHSSFIVYEGYNKFETNCPGLAIIKYIGLIEKYK